MLILLGLAVVALIGAIALILIRSHLLSASASDPPGSPYQEGREAHSRGSPKSENPYDAASEFLDHVEWEMGWEDAKASIPAQDAF